MEEGRKPSGAVPMFADCQEERHEVRRTPPTRITENTPCFVEREAQSLKVRHVEVTRLRCIVDLGVIILFSCCQKCVKKEAHSQVHLCWRDMT